MNDTDGRSGFDVRLTAIVRGITYKDWEFIVGKDAIGLYYLQVKFGARHSQSAAHQTWTGRKWRLSTHMTDSEIVQTALKAVLTAEEHEAREGFRWRGRAIFGPHISIWKLLAIMDDPDAQEVRD